MLTIVIPTRNRSRHLLRLLNYYAKLKCPYPILIGDSSDPDHLSRIKETIARFGNCIRIAHYYFPVENRSPYRHSSAGYLSNMLSRVETPYAVFVADDDFEVPRTMHEAMLFLEQHPDYSAVHGEAALCALSGEVYGEIRWIHGYPLSKSDVPTATARLQQYLGGSHGPLFSVMRTSVIRDHWGKVHSLGLDNDFGELLFSGLGLIHGKAKQLNKLFMVRQSHEQMTSAHKLRPLEWLTSPVWAAQYQCFRDCLAEALVAQDHISLSQAKEVVDEGFWKYLMRMFGIRRRFGYGTGRLSQTRVYQMICRIPGLRKMWRYGRALIPGMEPDMSLDILLCPLSHYREDFVPIYQAITTPPVDLLNG